jgi:hypothetical protein
MPRTIKREYRKNQRGGFSMSEFFDKQIDIRAFSRNVVTGLRNRFRTPPNTVTENIKAVTKSVSFGKLGGTRKRRQKKTNH